MNKLDLTGDLPSSELELIILVSLPWRKRCRLCLQESCNLTTFPTNETKLQAPVFVEKRWRI